MKAIIAEKPSVAREIAQLLQISEQKKGYLIGNGYCVTWALGHLVSLAMPEDYNIPSFQKESLPIIPNPFQLTQKNMKKGKSYHPDPLAVKQLKIINEVFDQCSSIIVATDAGREGELIFRYIYDFLKCKKPFERLWISSLTEKAIADGFKQLKAGSDFNGLYYAGKARSEADWLVGINASQALSISAGNEVYSLGRVQTPTLALICRRFQENQNFNSTKYWQIQLKHRKGYIDFTSQSSDQWDEKRSAEQILRFIEREGKAQVTDVQVKMVSESAPLLFDLTALQKEANRKLGFSADETLQIAQSLYEKKFITYPRTGSRYIPEDLWTEIPELVRCLNSHEKFKKAFSNLQFGNFNKQIVNDLKVTDHHALIITGKIPSTVSAKENAVYDMIAFSLLESLSEPCSKEITHITLKVNDYEFKSKGTKILQQGWRAIKGILSDLDENMESLADFPELKIGDELKISKSEILDKVTQPLKLYTEADVLSAMENAGKLIKDREEQKAIQNIGIGTPATRASIIETLLKRNYVERKNKLLIPTQKGLQVFELVKDKKIANVQMTAEWEMALHQIEQGESDEDDFLNKIKEYTSQITAELLSLDIPSEKQPVLNCPKCKNQILIIKDKVVKCPDEKCLWIQFRNICGVHLELADISSLLEKGKTSLLKNMTSKSGKKFDASLVLQDDYSTGFEFPDRKMKRK
ncbi:DNA topoisomerase 3 [Chryseobacterium chendengshani]|uniref:type IA DNA topoisomerase n=1 Tax=Chryseobacterium sp. LJ668 TaxID=2864040 RepID=UPI001C68D363|nr:type IA DNA topoisomerase [Chryseobacterium sp. LJ668]MBW8523863.1 DNA topoisomerase 3 [Chryseobacterium sp. LJ668]QYK16805.1 DNA topoisomerase 3 [Chryseobacterium sp. LJ668]